MSEDHVSKTLEMVQAQVQSLEQQLAEKKRFVNELCKLAGRDPIYAVTEPGAVATSIRADEFYGKPLQSVVRSILEKRQAAGMGAATVNDIFEAMERGGYKFDAKNEENSKRGLYVSLGKNTATFHKLPNGTYGLLEWYPNVKENKKAAVAEQKEGVKDKPLHQELQEETSTTEDTEEPELVGAGKNKAK